MLVYGDRERVAQTSEVLAQVGQQLDALRALPPGARTRSSDAAALAIACGIVVQALLDREHAACGCDELSAVACAGASLCLQAGRVFLGASAEPLVATLAELAACAPEVTLRLSEPEGYAFYALYPELYVEAARGLDLSDLEVQVLGIRSIGTSLSGFVAAACGASRLPFSLRPMGDPFAREVRIGPALAAALTEHAERTHYLIVDEGPGLSGSSFAAVASWLRARGVSTHRITFLPSHAGEPGGHGHAAVRALYRDTPRRCVEFEQVFPQPTLAGWFADVTGPADAKVQDLSAGRWRALHYPEASPLPPSDVTGERRKYLVRTRERGWLVKFVGPGPTTPAILARARVLSEHRLTPALVAARHGLSLSHWREDATPLPRARYDRAAFVAHVARYLGFLARHFPQRSPDTGALPPALFALLQHNAALLLGAERTAPLARYEAQLTSLTATHRAIAGDGKLDACEWLVLPDGSWLKCDAEAHHAGHDCIGAQDPAWDVAGASIELGLTADEREHVLRSLRDMAGVRLDVTKLVFYELAYAAFRAGRAHYALQPLAGWADEDAARLAAEKARYADAIAARL